jgi:aspartate ammonia-lyase
MADSSRTERDSLGERAIPSGSYYGIHTARAMENFPITGGTVHPALIEAYGTVKLACAVTNTSLGVWKANPAKADAIQQACGELSAGKFLNEIKLDPLQGGAGTSLNFAVNEVIANRALEILGKPFGEYAAISPLEDINLHQSTNDTFPTALKLAAILRLHQLEERLVALQEAFQEAEKKFAHVVKLGRTEMQDAVLTTLGREMSAYAEAVSRDRWRLFKCEERLRVVNLGGTAIGTGIAAPREFIFRVVDTLRDLTGIGFARAENLVDNTQNADVYVEVSGLLKTCAVNLIKISGDLRLMSSGPRGGFGEIKLPARQAGSSIMPGKINPVIPEAVTQAGTMMIGYDAALTQACAMGSLELNPFLPLISDCLLKSVDLLANAAYILTEKCVTGIEADETRCRQLLENSTAIATALLPKLGYTKSAEIAQTAVSTGKTVREIVIERSLMSESEFEQLTSAEAVTRLGAPGDINRNET